MLPRDQAATAGPVIVVDVAQHRGVVGEERRPGWLDRRGKTPVGGMGFAACFRDPEGNVVGLWETA